MNREVVIQISWRRVFQMRTTNLKCLGGGKPIVFENQLRGQCVYMAVRRNVDRKQVLEVALNQTYP